MMRHFFLILRKLSLLNLTGRDKAKSFAGSLFAQCVSGDMLINLNNETTSVSEGIIAVTS
jgi:hypothetical protein